MADDTTSQGRFIGGLAIVLLIFALAFAATMLLRLFTLWLPLMPGIVMIRGVAKKRSARSRQFR